MEVEQLMTLDQRSIFAKWKQVYLKVFRFLEYMKDKLFKKAEKIKKSFFFLQNDLSVVSCGGHHADRCELCGKDASHCNGECEWTGNHATGTCRKKM